MRHSPKTGFTLVEILIVISIIGILSGIVIMSVGPVRMKGRDTQRISDLSSIRIALEIYKSQNGTYPTFTPSGWAIDGVVGAYQVRWNQLKTALAPYIALPVDPLNSGLDGPWRTQHDTFRYAYISNGTKYDLVASLEDTKNPQRCEIKLWKYHTNLEQIWCTTLNYNKYLYADH